MNIQKTSKKQNKNVSPHVTGDFNPFEASTSSVSPHVTGDFQPFDVSRNEPSTSSEKPIKKPKNTKKRTNKRRKRNKKVVKTTKYIEDSEYSLSDLEHIVFKPVISEDCKKDRIPEDSKEEIIEHLKDNNDNKIIEEKVCVEKITTPTASKEIHSDVIESNEEPSKFLTKDEEVIPLSSFITKESSKEKKILSVEKYFKVFDFEDSFSEGDDHRIDHTYPNKNHPGKPRKVMVKKKVKRRKRANPKRVQKKVVNSLLPAQVESVDLRRKCSISPANPTIEDLAHVSLIERSQTSSNPLIDKIKETSKSPEIQDPSMLFERKEKGEISKDTELKTKRKYVRKIKKEKNSDDKGATSGVSRSKEIMPVRCLKRVRTSEDPKIKPQIKYDEKEAISGLVKRSVNQVSKRVGKTETKTTLSDFREPEKTFKVEKTPLAEEEGLYEASTSTKQPSKRKTDENKMNDVTVQLQKLNMCAYIAEKSEEIRKRKAECIDLQNLIKDLNIPDNIPGETIDCDEFVNSLTLTKFQMNPMTDEELLAYQLDDIIEPNSETPNEDELIQSLINDTVDYIVELNRTNNTVEVEKVDDTK